MKVIVLKVDQEKKRVTLGLKPSYFQSEDMEMPDADGIGENEAGEAVETDSEPQEEEMQIDSFVPTPVESQVLPLPVSGFNWTGETFCDEPDQREPTHYEAESDDDKHKRKPKHKRTEIKYDKTLDLPLSSAADFERTLLSKPDSSLIWTQYMAHLLQLGEIEKARAVAERALKTINIREEGEKMNIWVAYLNMENSYGSEETVEQVFNRSCEYMDKKKMHLHFVSLLIKSGKHDKVEELFQKILKKFWQSCKIWVNYATYLMCHSRVDQARQLLPQSLKTLPKRKRSPRRWRRLTLDVKTVSKFAQLEFKFASAEHGRTIMTGLLANYPRRFDLWNVFLDLEIKHGDKVVIRYGDHF